MRRSLLSGIGLFVVATLLSASTAYAGTDTITADGDTVAGGPHASVTNCAVSNQFNGLATIKRGSGSGDHFANGATVTVSSVPEAAAVAKGISTGGGGAVILPNPWDTSSADQTKAISVSVPSGSAAAMNGNYDVTVSATGTKSGGGTLTISGQYKVQINCPTDSTGPVVVPVVSGTLGNNGWYTSNVDVSWTVTDAESTVTSQSAPCTTTTSITADTAAAGQTVTCTATSAGGTTTQSVTIKRDATGPVLTCADADGAWHDDNVDLACTASDSPAGLADSGDAAFNLSTTVALGSEDADASTGTRAVSDAAGNSSTAGPVSGNQIDRKAPTISCNPASASWSATDVSISCSASDGGSGLADPSDSSFVLTTAVASGTETSDAATGTHIVTDNVGHSTTAGPISGNWVDKKNPTVECGAPDGLWHATDVTIGCTAADGGSGLGSESDASFGLSTAVPAGTEDANASTGTHDVPDLVGNTATAGPIAGNKVDKKAPTVSCSAADGAWHNNNANIGCTAADGGSGLEVPGDAAFTLSTGVAAGDEDGNAATGTHDVADAVGNTATAGPVSGNKVDRKAPTGITFGASIANGGSYVFGSVPPAPTCTADDGGSGLAGCVVTGYSTAVGPHTLTATATDNVGNQSTSTIAYTVQAWTLTGFYAPIDNWRTPGDPTTRVLNTVKGGSTVPVKFEVFAGATELTNVSAIDLFEVRKFSCSSGVAEDAIEVTTSGATVLRYDGTGGIFIQNWQTPKSPGTCYDVTVKTLDGSSITASFKLK